MFLLKNLRYIFLVIVAIIIGLSYVLVHITGVDFLRITENLIIEIIGSLFFGAIVAMFGVIYEDKLLNESHKQSLKKDLNLLMKLTKSVYKRDKSKWNFHNMTNTFYFDNSYLNSLYELITANDRRWESFIIEFQNENIKSIFVDKLAKFVDEMDECLIIAEKIDDRIKNQKINPELAAGKESKYLSDRQNALEHATLNYLCWRGYIAAVTPLQAFYGISENTNFKLISIDISNIENIYNEIKRQILNIDGLDTLIKKLDKKKQNMEEIISDLNTLI